jgi:lipoate-protein ligase A
LGVQATLCEQPRSDNEFLCFARRAKGDLVAGRHKIGGSAQRRRAGAVLQHGSVLLTRSAAAPELPGLQEITGIDIDPAALAAALAPRLARRFSTEITQDSLPAGISEQAAAIRGEKYAQPSWTNRR